MKTNSTKTYKTQFIRCIAILLFLQKIAVAQQTDFTQVEGWVRTASTEQAERSRSLTIDSEGNTIITGFFEGSISFSSPSKKITLNSNGLEDIFIVKYDVCGNIVWGKSIGAEEDDQGRSITSDAAGNIYVTGYYESKVDFDPGTEITERTSFEFTRDVFFAKFDKNGNFIWVKSIGGPDFDFCNAISLDKNGNIYLVGSYARNMNFNPTGTAPISSKGNSTDIFFAKYSPSGDYIWAKSLGGTFNEIGSDIKVNSDGEVYVTGYYAVIADFNPDPIQDFEIISKGQEDIFLAKFNTSGNLIWVNSMGGISSSERGQALEINSQGNLILAGQFNGTSDFDPSSGEKNLISKGVTDLFIASYSATGQLLWANGIGSNSNDVAYGLVLDQSNNIYATGYFSSEADFDPSDNGISNLTSNGLQDIFFMKLNDAGTYQWARNIGSNFGIDNGWDIGIHPNGNIQVTGFYTTDSDFDPVTNNLTLLGYGKEDVFLASYTKEGEAKLIGFKTNETIQCVIGNEFIFETIPKNLGNSLKLNWSFNSTYFGNTESASKSFTLPGEYLITLDLEDKFACKTNLLDTILVGDIPKAIWKLNDNQIEKCLLNNSFSFLNQSSAQFGTLSYLWNFGNGSTSNTKDPSINYTTAGTYPVTLSVTSSTGCSSEFSSILKVNPQPTGSFTVNNSSQCITGNSFVLRATSDAKNVLNWDFGDNITDQGKNVAHTYAKSGIYSVALSITNEFNCTEKIIQPIEVVPNPSPSIEVNFKEQPLLTNQFVYSTVNESNAIAYTWNLGDGTSSTGTTVSHTYLRSGTYTIQLSANNTRNCSTQTSTTVVVTANPPFSFDINNPFQCAIGNNFIFTPLPAPLPANINYKWTVNGNEFYSGTNTTASITLSNPGNYIIGMTLLGSGTNSITVTKTITVHPNPTVDFTVNKEKQCLSQNFYELNSTSTLANSFSWSFGDQSSGSPASSTIYSYAKAGIYTITLTGTSINNCSTSTSKVVEVFNVPQTEFTINNKRQSITSNVFEFTAIEKNLENEYKWSLGNNSMLSGNPLVYTYVATGLYTVKLNVIDKNQCVSESSDIVEVFSNSNLSFEVNQEQQCLSSNSFTFTNTSRYEESGIVFKWYLDNNLFFTGLQPTLPLSFGSTQQHFIKLVAIGSNGNKDSTAKLIRVLENPVSSFSIVNSLQQCTSSNEYRVLNKSSIPSGTLSFLWEFDDKNSTLEEPVIQFNEAGTYSITLKATSEAGCSSISSLSITVNPNPVTEFTINNPTQCASSNNFILDGTASSTGSTFLWNLPNGTTSTQAIVSNLSISTPGTYTVTLTTTNAFGCKSSKTKEVTILPIPTVDFSVNQLQQCLAGNLFEFTNKTTSSNNTQLSYLWKIGNSFTSELQTPNPYPFNEPGTYTITLTATSLNGNCSASKPLTVTVNTNPVTDFTINNPTQCASSNNFILDGTASSTGSTFLWNLPNGSTSTQSIVSNLTIPTPGTYTVTLTTTNTVGCQSAKTKEIVIVGNPVVNFTVNKEIQCIENNSYVFKILDNTVTTPISIYKWSFGDGGTSNEPNPTHSYQRIGIFEVSLQITNEKGCQGTETLTVETISNPNPEFSSNTTDQALATNIFNFTPLVKDGFSHFWQYGDGLTSTDISPSHTYTRTGSYKVVHEISNGAGCSSTYALFVNVNTSQSIKFDVNKTLQCLNGNEFIFTNRSLETNGIIFKWFANNELFFEGVNPAVKSFSITGDILIKLEATFPDGTLEVSQRFITIEDNINSKFTIETISNCLNDNKFSFKPVTDRNQNLTWNWNINSTPVSTQYALNYTFISGSLFEISLNVISISGCSSSSSTSITIQPNPVAEFSINSSIQCASANNFILDGTISSPGSTYLWNLPTGSTSTQSIVSNLSISTPGTYTVTLTTTNAFGCKSSKTKEVTILPIPTVDFSVNQLQQCLAGNLFEFTNKTTSSNNTQLAYLWKIGNSFTSELQTPNPYPFNEPGTYTITLTATSLNGNCSASKSLTVTVLPPASIAIKITESNPCLNTNLFSFQALTSNATSVKWDFADFTKIEEGFNVSHTFKESKIYVIKAIASNGNCIDTAFAEIEVLPVPVVNFSINDPEQCIENNVFEFQAEALIEKGSLSTFNWNFGDGNSRLGALVDYTYNKSGSYQVTLTGTSTQGCSSSISKTVNLIDAPKPQFSINQTEQCLTNNRFEFTNITNQPASFIWKMGDGNIYTTRNVTHSYVNQNRYVVNLIANYENGCSDSSQSEIIIKPSQITAFTVNNSIQCENNNEIIIKNNSSDPLGNLNYTWLFGDGTIKRDINPTHSYSKDGDYLIKLISTNIFGCLDSNSTSIIIKDLPELLIVANDSIQCLKGNNFILTAGLTQDPSASYTWIIEPDNTKSGFTINHQIQRFDTVAAKLIIGKEGCIDSTSIKLYVPQNPLPAFEVNDSIQCLQNNSFVFTNKSSGEFQPFTYEWRNENISFSKDASPTLNVNTAGFKKISLIITNNEGCIDSTQITLHAVANPVVGFSINDSTQCITNNQFQFTNTSTSTLALSSFIWKVDARQVSTLKDYNYLSNTIGNKNIRLIVTDIEGCTDSLSKIISVGEQPIGKQLPFVSAIVNRPIQLNARSFIKTNYNWTPKQGLSNYTIPNPVFQYDQEVQYLISMQNEFNCTYTDTLKVLIFKEKDILMPKAFSPNSDGVNDVIRPFLIGIQEFKYLRIFNRWGNLVYQDKDPNKGWDGFYKGAKQAMETYTWIAEGIDIDGQTIKRGGNFLLLR